MSIFEFPLLLDLISSILATITLLLCIFNFYIFGLDKWEKILTVLVFIASLWLVVLSIVWCVNI